MDTFKPVTKVVTLPGDTRKIYIPTLSFVKQIMSFLTDPEFMPKDKITKDYNTFTGKCDNDFWDPTTIDPKDSMAAPMQLSSNRMLFGITLSYFFKGPFPVSARRQTTRWYQSLLVVKKPIFHGKVAWHLLLLHILRH